MAILGRFERRLTQCVPFRLGTGLRPSSLTQSSLRWYAPHGNGTCDSCSRRGCAWKRNELDIEQSCCLSCFCIMRMDVCVCFYRSLARICDFEAYIINIVIVGSMFVCFALPLVSFKEALHLHISLCKIGILWGCPQQRKTISCSTVTWCFAWPKVDFSWCQDMLWYTTAQHLVMMATIC